MHSAWLLVRGACTGVLELSIDTPEAWAAMLDFLDRTIAIGGSR